MKYAVLILLFICFGCRSSRNTTDIEYRAESNTTQKTASKETIEQEKQFLETSRSESNTQIDEHIRTTRFNADGTISEVQEQWRTTGRNELADGTRSGSDVSGIVRTDSTATLTGTNIELSEHKTSDTDSRPVQGWKEWGIIALITGIVVLVVILIAINYVKKYRNKLS